MPTYLFNPGDGPVIIDDAGHALGGGHYAIVPDVDQVRDHVNAGRLVVVEAVPDTDPDSDRPVADYSAAEAEPPHEPPSAKPARKS